MSATVQAMAFQRVRLLSIAAMVIVALSSASLSVFNAGGTAQWQVWLAVVALAVGIPHGALDHLVTVPSMEKAKMAWFVVAYVAAASAVAVAIYWWPLWGFLAVVLMSAVHFGMGDASFIRQSSDSQNTHFRWWVYAVPAGAVPVIIPLTGEGSDAALALVNQDLVGWHFGFAGELFWSTVVVAASAIVWLTVTRHVSEAIDLAALLALVLLAPPLVAFAAYFGLWHAFRHTARLAPEFPSARIVLSAGQWVKALWRVTRPGLPALFGTMAIAAGIVWLTNDPPLSYLFATLAVVWALTVPHMALTWKLDKQALGLS
jgi:Brp/Blh family beta-carotene 15,15'-monooxygenase